MHEHLSVRRTALATGVTVAHVDTGPATGMPVVLLHAWGESRQSFDRLLHALPAGVRAITVDQRGHGDAGKPATGYTLTDVAADVVALLDELGEPSAVLVGSSSGGYVAQQVAVSWPDRVSGLVLVGAPRTLNGRPPFADEIDLLTDPVEEDWVRGSLAWFPLRQAVPRWYLDDRARDGTRVPAHVWKATLEGLVTATPPTEQGLVSVPTLVLRGDHDELLGGEAQDLAAVIAQSRTVVYEETGHLVLWEQPDRVAADLAEFLVDSVGAVIRPEPTSAPPPAYAGGMGEVTSRLRKSISKWANADDQHARDLRATHSTVDCTPIDEAPDRERVKLRGTLRTVTLRPRGGVPALEAELFDGTGVVLLVWLGRRRITGISPGRSIAVEGRIGLHDGHRVLYNPRYELKIAS